jgi:hypothetical protein
MDESALAALNASLAADGYQLTVSQTGNRVSASVTAGPEACADCLVPKAVFRGILAHTLGIQEPMIELAYPGENATLLDRQE